MSKHKFLPEANCAETQPVEPKKQRTMLYFLLGFLGVLLFVLFSRTEEIARQFIFHPSKYNGVFSTDTYHEVHFKNTRGETLYGYYFPYEKIAPGETVAGSILYSHGNADDISGGLLGFAQELRKDLQCNILIYDYAGYGKSEGEPTAKGILDDGRAARNWLAQTVGTPPNQIIVYGQSLGGSVAVDIAAKDGARALIVESSFTSLGDMGRRMFPFLPVNWLLRERLASVEKIGDFHGPVFISHGEADDVIPISQGKRLFAAANEPKTFYVPPKDLDYHSAPHGPEHRQKLREFVDSLPKSP